MTPKHAKAILPFITAFADGAAIQFNFGTNSDPKWDYWENPSFLLNPSLYRIKPKPQRVLMTVEDLPPGPVWISHILGTTGICELLVGISSSGLHTLTSRGSIDTFHREGRLWSTDRKTWNSFEKEVEA